VLWLKRWWASVELSYVYDLLGVGRYILLLRYAGASWEFFCNCLGCVKNEFKYSPVPSYVGVVFLVING